MADGLGQISNNGTQSTIDMYKKYLDEMNKNTGFLDNKGNIRWGGEGGVTDTAIQGLGAINAIGNTVLGFQNYGLAKDTFDFNKKMKNKEYAMALDAYNRQKARGESQSNQARTYGQISSPAVKSDTKLS